MKCYVLILSICYEAGRIFASSDCPAGETPVIASRCQYVPYISAKTTADARECCSGPLTVLAPAGNLLKDFETLVGGYGQRLKEGAYMTAFKISGIGELYLDGDIIYEDIRWKNGTRPTGNVSCIAVEPNSTEMAYYPVDCATELPFFCISVEEESSDCDICSADEECVPRFSTWCGTDCLPISTSPPVTSAPTHGQSPAVTDMTPVTLSVTITTGETTITPPMTDSVTVTKPPGNDLGAIIGGIVGAIVLLIIVILAIKFVPRWLNNRRNQEGNSAERNTPWEPRDRSWNESEGSLSCSLTCSGRPNTISRRRPSILNIPSVSTTNGSRNRAYQSN